jgi:hypothetical protein
MKRTIIALAVMVAVSARGEQVEADNINITSVTNATYIASVSDANIVANNTALCPSTIWVQRAVVNGHDVEHDLHWMAVGLIALFVWNLTMRFELSRRVKKDTGEESR